MQRACFWLLAVILLTLTAEQATAVFGCIVGVMIKIIPLGSCTQAGIIQQAREVGELALTTVLALLLAARNPPNDGDR